MIKHLQLRLAEMNDASALHETCWHHMTPGEVQTRLKNLSAMQEEGRVWGVVAVVGGVAVGFGQLVRWSNKYEISDLVVNEAWQGRGIGTALIYYLLDMAREQGVPEVEIGGAESNPRVLMLYRRLGFCDKQRVMLDLGQGLEPVIYLSIDLREARQS